MFSYKTYTPNYRRWKYIHLFSVKQCVVYYRNYLILPSPANTYLNVCSGFPFCGKDTLMAASNLQQEQVLHMSKATFQSGAVTTHHICHTIYYCTRLVLAPWYRISPVHTPTALCYGFSVFFCKLSTNTSLQHEKVLQRIMQPFNAGGDDLGASA